jgi:hypothetical protein
MSYIGQLTKLHFAAVGYYYGFEWAHIFDTHDACDAQGAHGNLLRSHIFRILVLTSSVHSMYSSLWYVASIMWNYYGFEWAT